MSGTDEVEPPGVVLDTNVFVAAAFRPASASGRIVAAVRAGRLRLVWDVPTRRETERILRRIPRASWEAVEALFRPDGAFSGPVAPEAFARVADPEDRKFAALAAAAGCPLVSSDDHLLAERHAIEAEVLAPREFLDRLDPGPS